MPELRHRFTEAQPLEPADERIVAVLHGSVVGFLDLVGNHVSNLFVDLRHEGQGIGTALMTEAKRRVTGDLTLSVFTLNPDALRLNERLGFQPRGWGRCRSPAPAPRSGSYASRGRLPAAAWLDLAMTVTLRVASSFRFDDLHPLKES